MDSKDLTFLETQFPVSKLSKESYKERKAGAGQTLTGLGKWWGRKPLVLVRSVILGLLLPATADPKKDRDIFLKIMTMDEEGLWRRLNKAIPASLIVETLAERAWQGLVAVDETTGKAAFVKGIDAADKAGLQRQAFAALSYDEKLTYCERPEQIEGPSPEAWAEINAHLGTHATHLPELVRELGVKRFGHAPRVGDAFCGGGSIPFEAARIGCDAYASDLNPVAALLTWGALNIVGGGPEVADQVRKAQQAVYDAVDRQVTAWGIEHNAQGWRADAFLYCNESTCPECGWSVPLAPSWVIGEKSKTVAVLEADTAGQRFHIRVKNGVAAAEMKAAKDSGTVKNSELCCPNCNTKTPISTLRGDRRVNGKTVYGLRMWENEDIVPRPTDVFQERLYCIRWVETSIDAKGKERTQRHYRAPTGADLERETRVVELLRERFSQWQAKGYIPSMRIEDGDETSRLMRERGWTHWHHLFNARQLLVLGSLHEVSATQEDRKTRAALINGIGQFGNFNSRLVHWHSQAENSERVFYNQAMNTFYNFSVRSLNYIPEVFFIGSNGYQVNTSNVKIIDARKIDDCSDLWITDPPYADAVNYHELTEFFLAWYEKHLPSLFPGWYADTKRALAVKGNGQDFRKSMVDVYSNLARNMPDNGLQVVMFTHQDAGVWADLALILWAAGLQVSAAWTIATETSSGLKQGNYVQGTVLLVLRKQLGDDIAFTDEIGEDIKPEVERQLAAMLALDDQDDPNFSDADYQLAAYAAALRVITRYRHIEGVDAGREIARVREKGEKSVFEQLIVGAVKIASNFLIPKALHDSDAVRRDIWRMMSAEERFYLKALEVESHGEGRQGVYQEFARGFGLKDYGFMLQSGKANETRLKTATGFKRRELGTEGFGLSLLRQCLFAVAKTQETGEAEDGLTWLRAEVQGSYWRQREAISALLRYLSRQLAPHWEKDAETARILAGAVENDQV